jgi:hypothetical protein
MEYLPRLHTEYLNLAWDGMVGRAAVASTPSRLFHLE